MLFAHATGFHGRCWDEIVSQFPGRHSLAVDFRGHGRSDKPDPPYVWPEFGNDLAEIADQLGIRDAVGIGHSMGGHSVVAAAIRRPETFRALLLLDPTIFPVAHYGLEPPDVGFVLRRRNRWESAEEMFERFRHRPPFVRWRPEILRDYCEFGLLPGDGGLVLACPPAVEASIYMQSRAPESNLYAGIPSVEASVVVVRAGTTGFPETFDPNASPTAPDLAWRFPNGRDVFLHDRGHFIPMECPDLVAAEIAKLITSDRTAPPGEFARP